MSIASASGHTSGTRHAHLGVQPPRGAVKASSTVADGRYWVADSGLVVTDGGWESERGRLEGSRRRLEMDRRQFDGTYNGALGRAFMWTCLTPPWPATTDRALR